MSSLPNSAVMGMHRFDTDDAMLNTEVNENTDDIDTIPPTVCTSGTRPATNLYQGRLIYETDTKNYMMYDLNSGSPLWRYIGTDMDMPAPVRGYMINTTKNITATAWAAVASDIAKAIVVPAGKKLMVSAHMRAQMNGTGGTAVQARLGWTGATTGNMMDHAYDSAVLGALTATAASTRDGISSTILLNAGTTTFQTQAQRSNTTNAVSIDSIAVVITPIAWGDAFDPAST